MCLKKYYKPPEAMPKFLPFLDLAKVTFWTKGFVLEKTINSLGWPEAMCIFIPQELGKNVFYRMNVFELENSM